MFIRSTRGNARKITAWVQPVEAIESRILLSGATLDAWFGNNGVVPGYVADQVQLNGKILAHDSAGNAVRLNPDGSKDTSFNSATDIPPASQPGVYQADGKRLVLDSSGVITRYNKDNSVDTTFGNGGHVSTYLQQPTRYLGQAPDPGDTPYQNMSFTPERIALQGSQIIVAGIVNGQTASGQRLHTQYGVERFSSNGAQDTSFGLVAYRTTNFDVVFPQ